VGFAAGNNTGIRRALKDGAEYVIMLNNDTIVEPNFVRALVDTAISHPKFDVFGPKIVFYSDPGVIWAAGSHIDWQRGVCIQHGYRESDQGQYDTDTEVNALTACAMMISRKAFETVGLLDNRFFIYYEETDWCARAVAAGFRILYVPHTVVRHKISATTGACSPALVFYMTRNNLLFIAKNSSRRVKLWLLARSLCSAARASCSGLVKGKRKEAVARLRAMRAFLCGRFGKTEV
jgi:GT2 family glycosyltransferase